MKLIHLILSIFIITACSSGNINSQSEIEQMAGELLAGRLTERNIKDQIIAKGYIDAKVNFSDAAYSGLDSSIIIEIEHGSILGPTAKNYVYDFAKKPRNIGGTKNAAAAYTRTQLNDRWYIEEFGFD